MITREAAYGLLAACKLTTPAIIGIRGSNDMNKIGVFDDTICLVTPTEFSTCVGNTDPSKVYPRVAVLRPGIWWYRKGIHGIDKPKDQQYMAFVQAAPVVVDRHQGIQGDTGYFGINIHRGGNNTTSSAGCQTIHAPDWETFRARAYAAMEAAGVEKIPYVLVEAPVNADNIPPFLS
jgi:hypothetical protein